MIVPVSVEMFNLFLLHRYKQMPLEKLTDEAGYWDILEICYTQLLFWVGGCSTYIGGLSTTGILLLHRSNRYCGCGHLQIETALRNLVSGCLEPYSSFHASNTAADQESGEELHTGAK